MTTLHRPVLFRPAKQKQARRCIVKIFHLKEYEGVYYLLITKCRLIG